MQITNRKNGKDSFLNINRRLVLGRDLVEFRNAVHDAIGNSPNNTILNLANVSRIDMRGIGELVATFNYINSKGGHMILTNLPKRVKILLEIAQLTKVFEIRNSEHEATINFQRHVPLNIWTNESSAGPSFAFLQKI
jgi:anti-anti-sigma factor